MKKKLLGLLMSLIAVSYLYANPVDVATAQTVALNFIANNATAFTKGTVKSMNLAYTNVSSKSVTCFYVFNSQNTKGFVIVAADDLCSPILGYSDESNFDTARIPVQLKELLQGYSKQIAYIIANNTPASLNVVNKWQQLKLKQVNNPAQKQGVTTVGSSTPLIQTLWDQSPYYNNLCPYDNQYSDRTVTGCVATAMAQVMKYWNWPLKGTGSNSYTPESYSYLGVQTANFASTTYDWNNMPQSLSSSSTSAQLTAVSTLMFDCGVSVNMDYGVANVGGSGAYSISYGGVEPYCSENALKNYFSYNSSLQGLQRSNYADTQWISLLKNEINSLRPVIYTGQGNQGGHCFVADAYDTSNLFHFNWGWSGYANGFFNLNALNPATDTFNAQQTALIGIKPNNTLLPVITSFSPTSAGTGSTVTITGSNFTGATSVSFGGIPASSFKVVSDVSITAVIGNGASGNITVTNATGTQTYSGFVFKGTGSQPVITAFTPTSAAAGTTVIIAGSNFTGVTGVSFGGVPATSYTVVSATAITAVVGNGASGIVSVTNASGTGSFAGFNFIASPPTISSFSPTSGPVGTTVTITGTNFSTTPTNNIVYFGAVSAIVSASTSTTLTVTVPAGASYQPITVTTNNLTAYSSKIFNVSFPGASSSFTTSNFSSYINFTNGAYGEVLAIGDLDNDGQPDVVMNEGANNILSVFRNSSTKGNVSFAKNIDFTLANAPNGFAVGDLDGDGKLDVVSVCYTSGGTANIVSVFRNTSTIGNIALATRQDIASGNYYTVDIVDIDGDGKPDIVASNMANNSVSVFMNTSTPGNISFATKVDFSIGSQPIFIAVGDIDGDGKPDVCAVNQNANTVTVLMNNSTSGTISFASAASFATGSSPRCVAIGDIDGDGKADLAVGNSGGASVSVLRNIGSIGSLSFASHIDFSVGATPVTISIADLDGDGKPDIGASCASSGTFSLLKNNCSIGSISFNAVVNYPSANTPYQLGMGDFDGDGQTDVLVGNGSSTTFSILRNQQNQPVVTSFTPTSGVTGTTIIISGSNFTGVTAVSFGGIPASSFTFISSTAIIATVGAGASGSVSVTTPLGTGSLSGFTYTVPIPTITSFTPVSGPIGTTVTITGTNFSTTPANNIVYFGAVRATVTAATSTTLTVTVPYGATYLPITVNTNNLIAQSSIPFTVTFAGGGSSFTSNTFSTKIDYTVKPSPGQTAVSDLDGDGKADIIVANGSTSNSLSIFRNISSKGSISLSSRVDFTTTGSPYGLNYADLDGDGKPDITFTNYGTGNFGIFRNISSSGNISLASEIDFTSGTNPASTAFGDFDGDGKLDIVVGNVGSASISVYRNLSTVGNISFTAKADYSTGSSPFVAAVADIDGDGKPDIIVSIQGSPIVTVYRNTSTGVGNISFTNAGNFTAGSGPRCVSVADIDGDGKLDLVVGNSAAASVSILMNTSTVGNISFATKVDFATGTSTVPTQISITDFDGDGKPDFVVAEEPPTNVVSVFKNNSSIGSISFNNTVNFSTDVNPYGVSTGDIDGDGKPDIIVANGGSSAISIFRNQVGEPVITSFTPTSSASGGSVIISGVNFTGATNVSFGGIAASSYTVVSSIAIIATVGAGASGSVSVTTPLGTGSLSGFTYTVPIPTITSFTPVSGPIGTTVTITGTNFSTTPANNIVYFGAVKATVSAATTNSLTVTVPAGATYKPITVTTSNLTAFSAKPFMVTFAGGGYLDTTSFARKLDYTPNSSPNFVGIQDIDGDGKPDLFTTDQSANTISLFRNTTTSINNISFAPKVLLNTGTFPIGISFADFDGDGKADFVAASYTGNTINIYKNNSTTGNFSFAAAISYPTGTDPFYPMVGDFDGDGKPDIVLSNVGSATVSVFLNTSTPGNISFAAKVDFSVGSSPSVIALADIDGDGKLDIICPNQGSSTVSVLRNTSTGVGNVSFSTTTLTSGSGSSGPRGVSVGDFDGDGLPDIVAANSYNSSISVFRNTSTVGNISFAAKNDYSLSSSSVPMNTTIADLDGDGKLDILVPIASTFTYVNALRNNSTVGNISFQPVVNFTVESSASGTGFISVGDLDGDGKPELVTANGTTTTISILRNQTGEPVITSFTPTSASQGSSVIISGENFTGATSVTIGGVAATYTVVSSTAIIATVGSGASGSVCVTTQTGTNCLSGFIFTVPVPTITAFSPVSGPIGTTVTITGTNFSTTAANNIVYFGAAKAIVTSSTATSLTVTVPTGTTYQPITVTTRNLTAFSAKPFTVTFAGGGSSFTSTSFKTKTDFKVDSGSNSLASSDFDGDGKVDLIVTNRSAGSISVLRNISTSGYVSFATKVNFTTSGTPWGICVFDLDGDGKQDIATANYNTNTLGIFRNTSTSGNVSVASETDYTTGTSPNFVTVSDFDGDGKPDIVVANSYSATVSVFLNTSTPGNISFASKIDFAVGGHPNVITIADIDGDGKADIISANQTSSSISVLRNTSSGIGNINFATQVTFTSGGTPYPIAVGDIDGDGKPDIVTGNANVATVSIFTNTSTSGNISFATHTDFSTGTSTVPIAIALTDLDGDGKLDISVAGASPTNVVSVLRNLSTSGNISFDATMNYTTGSAPYSVAIGDIDGDGKPDIAVANANSSSVSVLRNQVGEPVITSFTPTAQSSGQTVIISGVNFTGTTSVTFGGIAATNFTVVSSTAIIATVGNGASGSVTVTTPYGTATLAGFTYISCTATTASINKVSCNSYTWHGTTYTTSGSYTFDSLNAKGCDSLTTLNLTINKPTSATINYATCNSYLWHGTTYTTSGSYTFDSLNAKGCDSLTTLNLTINKPTTATITKSSCISYSWHGTTYTTSGSYTFDSLNAKGCDSLTTLNLTINKPTTAIISKTVCTSYTWHGTTYTTSGSYTFDSLNAKGCDSLTTLNLTINKPTSATVNYATCNSYLWHGTTYTTSGSYTFDSLNVKGCDSLTTLNLTINKPTTATITKSACSSYTWHGTTYTTSGSYTFDSLNAKGCDSLTTLNLTINKPTSATIAKSACNSYLWHGTTYTTSGIYTFDSLNAKGCDSLTTLNLTINKPTTAIISKTVCTSYTWHGTTYTTSGSYTFDSLNTKGCDSLTTLVLTVNSKPTILNSAFNACDSVVYKGVTYYSSTIHTDTLRSIQGCDSIYNVATITVTPTPVITGISSNTPVNTGDSIKLTVTANSGNLYSWTGPLNFKSSVQDPTIYSTTLAMSGTYYVNVSNGNCKSLNDSVIVNISTVYSISGTVWHPKGYTVQNAELNVGGQITFTDVNGSYSTKLLSGGNYTVVPLSFGRSLSALRTADRLNVSTLDVALVQSHILQKNLLNSPYKIFAADVNSDGHVSALDIVYMKRLILALDSSFPGNKLWGYVDSGYVFPDPTNPFPTNDSIVFSNLNANAANQSFIGFILGDVNWSAIAPRILSDQSLELYYNNINTASAEVIKVPVSVKNFNHLIGMQFTLKYNNNAFDFVGLNNNVLGMEYAVHDNGSISFIWNSPDNELKTIQDGSTLLELVLKPKSIVQNESLTLSSDITAIEAVDGNFETHDIILQKGIINNEPVIAEESWNLVPNPTDGIIKINMNTKLAKTINFELNDMNGKILLSQKMELVKGVNNFNLNLQTQNRLASGTYYLKAKGIEGEIIKKVIVR